MLEKKYSCGLLVRLTDDVKASIGNINCDFLVYPIFIKTTTFNNDSYL